MTTTRLCTFCGQSIEALRSDAKFCGSSCRAQHWMLSKLLSGSPAGPYATPKEFAEAFVRDRQSRLEKGKKRRTTARAETRTIRAERWLMEQVREKPGHVTRAQHLYAAYRTWAEGHESDGPLSYGAFLRAVDRNTPLERRVTLMTARGRPQVAFEGIVLTRRRSGPDRAG
jgi:hypothetical protein